jgi:ribosome-associated protein
VKSTKKPAAKRVVKKNAAKSAAKEKTVKTKKAPAKKAPAPKSPAKKLPAKKSPVKTSPVKDAPAKKAPAKRSPARKASAKKSPTKKSPAKKSTAKITPAKEMPVKIAPLETSLLLERIVKSLDDDKAEEIVTISLAERSSLCDAIVVASGHSTRHVASCAEHLVQRLKDTGYGTCRADGVGQGDWALVDAGDVIVHIFRPEVRRYYDIEGLWSVEDPTPKPKSKRTKAK